MKVIFVGLHNKPHKMPLCSSTKSGKLIDRIILQLSQQGFWGEECTWQKTNLFDVDYYPTNDNENWGMSTMFWQRVEVNEDDVLVLLGAAVQRDFVNCPMHKSIIKVAHPASKRSHEEMNEYVKSVASLVVGIANKRVVV